jgi:hypothetical protein
LKQAIGLAQHGEPAKADATLEALEQNYGDLEWLSSKQPLFDTAQAAVKAGVREQEAEKLYAEAAKLFAERQLFDVKPIVQKLRGDYALTSPVITTHRTPSFAELEHAVADLGQFITVRQDGKADFTSIQAAIDAAEPNSLIEIQDNGPYNEKINIQQEGLSIRGKTGCWPIITSLGPVTDFPTLMRVHGARVRLERLLLAHYGAAGGYAALSARDTKSLSMRSCVVSGAAAKNGEAIASWVYVSHAVVENCVFLGPVVGRVTGKRSIFCDGIRQPGLSVLEDCVVQARRTDLGATIGDMHLVRCTLPSILIRGPNANLVDCIMRSVTSDRPRGVLEHCNVYGSPPFIDGAKPGEGCFPGAPQFIDPKMLDYRLMPTSPCIGKASDGGDVGCRYTPEMIEIIQKALELRTQGIIKF